MTVDNFFSVIAPLQVPPASPEARVARNHEKDWETHFLELWFWLLCYLNYSNRRSFCYENEHQKYISYL